MSVSPAMLVALVALSVSVGGSSYAALTLPKASVGGKQLKRNAVTSPKVKPGSLLLSDFRASERLRLRGPEGPQGARGPAGSRGEAGATNVTLRLAPSLGVAADQLAVAVARCLRGERAVGGGADAGGPPADISMVASQPWFEAGSAVPTGWRVKYYNRDLDNNNSGDIVVAPVVACASP